MFKTTLVLGASENEVRYSNMAIRKLRAHNIPVIAVGLRPGKVLDVPIVTDFPKANEVHTVTLYVNPERQKTYYEPIVKLRPKHVIFNPGTENRAFEKVLEAEGIAVEVACTLVLLSTNQYE